MHISRAGEYGVLGLLHLVRQPAGQPVMIDAVSRDESIPKSFLAKIFQDLAKAGILRSQRGAGGGFALARPADQISILDIIEAIDGKIALQRCLGEVPDCEKRDDCALCSLFEEAQYRLKEVFGRTTLQQLATRQTQLETRNGNDRRLRLAPEAPKPNGHNGQNGHDLLKQPTIPNECPGCTECGTVRTAHSRESGPDLSQPFTNQSLALEP